MSTPESRVSIVVTVVEELVPLGAFIAEYDTALREGGYDVEFVVVSEPGHLDRVLPLENLLEAARSVRIFQAAQYIGETGLLRAALPHCRGEIVVILPAYHRIVPSGVATLVERVRNGAAMATASRTSPSDSWRNRAHRKVFNAIGRRLIGGEFSDLSSGVRAVRREALLELPVYGDFLRFLPAFARRDGFVVEEVPIAQHVENLVSRTYSPGTYLRRLIDLLAVFFLVRFREKPLRFFGLIGATLASAGGLLLTSLLIQRLGGQAVGDRPQLVLGVLLLVLGVQGVALGLVGEIIVFASARQRKPYRLARVSPPAAVEANPTPVETGGAPPATMNSVAGVRAAHQDLA